MDADEDLPEGAEGEERGRERHGRPHLPRDQRLRISLGQGRAARLRSVTWGTPSTGPIFFFIDRNLRYKRL